MGDLGDPETLVVILGKDVTVDNYVRAVPFFKGKSRAAEHVLEMMQHCEKLSSIKNGQKVSQIALRSRSQGSKGSSPVPGAP